MRLRLTGINVKLKTGIEPPGARTRNRITSSPTAKQDTVQTISLKKAQKAMVDVTQPHEGVKQSL